MQVSSEGVLTAGQVAARLGVAASTWRSYVSRGQAPGPDVVQGVRKLWSVGVVDDWVAKRPGRGYRTDRLGEFDPDGLL